MGIIKSIKRWWSALWQKEAEDKFGVDTIESDVMTAALKQWTDIYRGRPAWANEETGVESFNFAKKLCNETARLTTLALGIAVEAPENGTSNRAEYLNDFMTGYIARLKDEVCEKACAFGYVLLKPAGNAIDYVMPWNFAATHSTGSLIDGGIFFDKDHKPGDKWYYTRLEYHRFENEGEGRVYRITNKAYRALSDGAIGQEVDIKESPWSGYEEDVSITGVDKPLFAVLRMPIANNIDLHSPLPVSIYANATKELKSLDIAWTRLEDETFDSQKITYLGDMLMDEPGKPVRGRFEAGGAYDKTGRALPRRVRILPGSTTGEEYHEDNPVLQSSERIATINHYLNLVGVKCGYSTGQFVLDGRSGQITATQVESDDRETIQTIKQIRDSVQVATDAIIYALSKWADLYGLAPVGEYSVSYDFGDISYSWDEDRARHWQYVIAGKYPLWRYYAKFEGMTEEEAKAVVAEANGENQQAESLFGEE